MFLATPRSLMPMPVGNKWRRMSLDVQAIATGSSELGSASVAASGPLTQMPPGFRNDDWAAAFQSQPSEYSYWIDEIEGTIPEGLRGTLFRNGPGNFERGKQKYHHMLDGDGYVCAFSFNFDGRVHFKSRYVRTRELINEERENRVLYRNTFGTQKAGGPLRNAFDLQLKNPANTNVIVWGRRLFALWEAGAPYELDPFTLQTKPEPATLDGWIAHGVAPSTTGSATLDRTLGLGNALTAHPHVQAGDEETARLVTWSWQSRLRPMGQADMSIDIREYDSDWRHVAGASFNMEDCFFNPHDFAFSATTHVFFQNSCSFAMVPYLLGIKGPAQCVELTDAPMKIFLVPRDASKPKVVEADPCFLIHHANGYDDGDEVVVWSSGWGPDVIKKLAAKANGGGMLGSWKVVMQGDFSDIPVTRLWRHRVNKVTGEVSRDVLFERSMDHPRVNPLFYGKPTRYVFFNMSATTSNSESKPPQAFTRLDTHSGDVQSWFPGERCFCEELIFVPGPQGATKEDDGYLLGMVFDAEKDRSMLVVLDASDFNKGPIARIWLQHKVPHGLHGYFSDLYFGPHLQ
ncbi:hypothetical protein WJX72_002263 [[Myrmecia] bisecta]|uniref:Carotenoid oxygenase n=1 Tax=[Myrmecia] bisecta TaxID=41462 RepID=A0AAW1QQL8_9CHLO